MLSQKLSKEILKLRNAENKDVLHIHKEELEKTLDLWTTSHEGLLKGSKELNLPETESTKIKEMFKEVQVPFDIMVKNCKTIIGNINNKKSIEDLNIIANEILSHENEFLQGMDAIVFQYDQEAKKKLDQLKRLELFLFIVAIIALLLELFFIFRPTAHFVQKTVNSLTTAEKKAKESSLESSRLYEEKERTLQELKALNFAVDQASLFASVTLNGDLTYISNKFAKFIGYNRSKPTGKLANLLTINEGEQDYITQLITTPRSTIWTGEVSITNLEKEKCWLNLSIVPVNRSGMKQSYLILCDDITERKKSELELERLSQEKFNEEVRLQKIRSSQIVDAQEKERERIAREMHDGIGQMLTALKFNLESLNPERPDSLEPKIEELKELSIKLIKGVRIATFNLTPPELTDYGISTALSKLCIELRRMTGQNILFVDKTSHTFRYDSIIETNIYRITQEAVNNAIKYSKANYILVTLSTSENLVSVKIDDDGIGFDPTNLKKQSSKDDSSHMGLSFMEERVNYIYGRLFMHSTPGKGTRITINVPTSMTKAKI